MLLPTKLLCHRCYNSSNNNNHKFVPFRSLPNYYRKKNSNPTAWCRPPLSTANTIRYNRKTRIFGIGQKLVSSFLYYLISSSSSTSFVSSFPVVLSASSYPPSCCDCWTFPSPTSGRPQKLASLTSHVSSFSIRRLSTDCSPFDCGPKATATMPLRRSTRLAAAASKGSNSSKEETNPLKKGATKVATAKTEGRKRTRKESPTTSQTTTTTTTTARGKTKATRKKAKQNDLEELEAANSNSSKDTIKHTITCLPRSRELFIIKASSDATRVMGVDEAGRGPLAGPVVAAAAIVPMDIDGITDSKKITKESVREELYEKIIACKDTQYAIAIVDASKIDEINILQASLLAMRMAVETVISCSTNREQKHVQYPEPSVSHKGCYVVCGNTSDTTTTNTAAAQSAKTTTTKGNTTRMDTMSYYALIDGNKVPADMPCDCESIIKGDSKEYNIAAASILAKVTRDRLMHQYHEIYPKFDLTTNKGYPTAKHMKAVHDHGASPIHRYTFAPLKHMKFNKETGKIIK